MYCPRMTSVQDLPSQVKEPMGSHDKPMQVFEHMAADIFSNGGANFLVITDIKLGWPTTFHLGQRLDAGAVIDATLDTLQHCCPHRPVL